MLIEIQVAVSILKYTLVHSMSLEESFENYLNSFFDTDNGNGVLILNCPAMIASEDENAYNITMQLFPGLVNM